MKRNEQRGGFWQPVTGGVEDGENLIEAVNRELREETGVTKYLRIIENLHYFEFQSERYGKLKEYVFGVEVDSGITIKISPEHTEMKWCDLNDALTLLKHDNNKVGFKKISQLISIKLK